MLGKNAYEKKGWKKVVLEDVAFNFDFLNFTLIELFFSWNILQRIWVFATTSNLLIPISYQPDGVYLWYFKLRSFDQTEFIVWNN